MHRDLARVAREALKSHRKRDDALHGGSGGALAPTRRISSSLDQRTLHELEQGVSKKRSDVTSGPHDDGRAFWITIASNLTKPMKEMRRTDRTEVAIFEH